VPIKTAQRVKSLTMCRGSSVSTTDPQSRYGSGMGGHSGRRALDYQVSWREQAERAQAVSRKRKKQTGQHASTPPRS
jgi:hypothetical protein